MRSRYFLYSDGIVYPILYVFYGVLGIHCVMLCKYVCGNLMEEGNTEHDSKYSAFHIIPYSPAVELCMLIRECQNCDL